MTRSTVWTALLLISGALHAGCTSPESLRSRGSGSGADTGNRPEEVRMHGGSDPFWMTPASIGETHPPLDPARHARQVAEQ